MKSFALPEFARPKFGPRNLDLRRFSIAFLIALSIWSLGGPGLSAQTTDEVVARYIDLNFSQRYDELIDLYAPDAVFHDPTGDVFEGPVSEGPVRGASSIIAMQKSWGLAETRWEIDASFSVGQYNLRRGILNVRYQGSDQWIPIPLVTVLRVVDGRIAERTDFGDYTEPFGLSGFDEATASTRDVAGRALRAYLDGDVETQIALSAEDIQFQDPTSRVYGPPSGELYQGVDVLAARRRQIYVNVSDFDLDVEKEFVGNHHAVFMGTTTYTVRGGQRFEQPAVFVFEVRDGKVTRQWDFVDYTVGPVG